MLDRVVKFYPKYRSGYFVVKTAMPQLFLAEKLPHGLIAARPKKKLCSNQKRLNDQKAPKDNIFREFHFLENICIKFNMNWRPIQTAMQHQCI